MDMMATRSQSSFPRSVHVGLVFETIAFDVSVLADQVEDDD